MKSEIHAVVKYYFLKPIIFRKSLNSMFSGTLCVKTGSKCGSAVSNSNEYDQIFKCLHYIFLLFLYNIPYNGMIFFLCVMIIMIPFCDKLASVLQLMYGFDDTFEFITVFDWHRRRKRGGQAPQII